MTVTVSGGFLVALVAMPILVFTHGTPQWTTAAVTAATAAARGSYAVYRRVRKS